MNLNEALKMAVEALQREAYAEHTATLDSWGPDVMVTCDMCLCGQTTGAGASPKCKSLSYIYDLTESLRKAGK